ncbi:uncharacterized protein METZ01_LOCUS463747 [marine metagenome]|uniref:Uncharacterized protein n=1 Tax=marine metagenome TaxID=408172 RepID=A0A383ATJ7_9ZZZZ
MKILLGFTDAKDTDMKRPQHLNKPAAETEKRNFSRLDLKQEPALSAVLVLPDRSAFYTPLRNLSANGFSCELLRVVSLREAILFTQSFFYLLKNRPLSTPGRFWS